MEFSSTYKKFPSSKTSNIAATYLKFCTKQRAGAPLLGTKSQACSCNIAGFRAIRKFSGSRLKQTGLLFCFEQKTSDFQGNLLIFLFDMKSSDLKHKLKSRY